MPSERVRTALQEALSKAGNPDIDPNQTLIALVLYEILELLEKRE